MSDNVNVITNLFTIVNLNATQPYVDNVFQLVALGGAFRKWLF